MEMSAPKFELIEHKDASPDHWCIKIKDGEYKGVIYQYQTVKIQEEKTEDGAVLQFKTAFIETPDSVNLTKEKDQSIMGAILVNILNEQFETVKDSDEDGTSNTQKFNHG
jgi:hypothetical protein